MTKNDNNFLVNFASPLTCAFIFKNSEIVPLKLSKCKFNGKKMFAY